ncbi:MAG: Holliday junction branch migration protein RuvA [Candidatus Pacebacteria bacterium]|nr:Holliday junction branch migration protein RuvA [Candidatus Paceibacterota bacterium]
MIAEITGVIKRKSPHFLIIETGGVGFKVFVTENIAQSVSEKNPVTLFTHLAVRENSLDLYGFTSIENIEFFEQLLSVSGIGPKSALTILNTAPVEVLRRGILLGDTSHLSKVSGIGRKSAEKIVLGLKDKVGKTHHTKLELRNEIDTIEALTALGYRERDAREALVKVPAEITDTGEKVKKALKILGAGI